MNLVDNVDQHILFILFYIAYKLYTSNYINFGLIINNFTFYSNILYNLVVLHDNTCPFSYVLVVSYAPMMASC